VVSVSSDPQVSDVQGNRNQSCVAVEGLPEVRWRTDGEDLIAQTWGEYLTHLWNTEMWSWDTLYAVGLIAILGMLFK
jgi:hypothetical protein